ncbi:MAG: glycosyltransferase family 4 protein [Leptolyngbyaceae cyanobacterium RM1_1_2]|nr:glycosyltransferase family 4 protein [Leptolyngbyaceae cyanobacterium RM1_1_2]
MTDTPLLVNLSILTQRPTGIDVYARQVTSQLKSLEPKLLSQETIKGFEHQVIPGNLSPESGKWGHFRRLVWLQQQLPRYYSRFNSDLIFSPLPEAPLYTRCRFVVTAHDVIPLHFPKRFSRLTNYFRYYVPRVLHQAAHIICDSQSTANDLIQFYQLSADKITPILLGYDSDNFKLYNLPEGNYFVYIGRQDIYKNLERLIYAFEIFSRTNECELWLIGPTHERYTPVLKEQAKTLGIARYLRFLDYVSYAELPRILSRAIALTFPSLWEGFGLPALEAMACGTPVITSNLSSLPEVVGSAAILINPYSIDELASAMQAVANNSQLRRELKVAGLRQSKKFNWAKTGQQTVELLKNFL